MGKATQWERFASSIPSKSEFQPTKEAVPPGGPIGEAERMGRALRFHHPGNDAEPQLFEVDLDPDLVVPAHAHRGDEIIVMLGGKISFSKRIIGPGSNVMIPGGTFYGFRVGAKGCHFLNFRSSADSVYRTRQGDHKIPGTKS